MIKSLSAQMEIPRQIVPILGKGYDLTKGYAVSSDIKAPVLNYDKLLADGIIMEDTNASYNKTNTFSGESMFEYQKKLTQNLNVNASASIVGMASFSTEIRSSFGEDRGSSVNYIMSTQRVCVGKAAYYLNSMDVNNLKPYLSSEFLADLQGTLDAAKLQNTVHM